MGASGSLACIHPVVPPTTFPPCLFPRCSLQPGKTLPGIHPWKISSQAAVGWEKGYCRRSQRSQGLRAGHTGRFRWLPRSAIPLPVSPAPLPLALPTLFLVISWAHSREEPGNFPTSLETPRLRLAWEREPRWPQRSYRFVPIVGSCRFLLLRSRSHGRRVTSLQIQACSKHVHLGEDLVALFLDLSSADQLQRTREAVLWCEIVPRSRQSTYEFLYLSKPC